MKSQHRGLAARYGRRAARRAVLGAALLALAVLAPQTARAQEYRFAVPEMKMQVYVQPDASVRVEYEIHFHNDRRGRAIDAVDIGLFHRNYDIQRMMAAVDGRPVTSIGRSPYVNPGVEVRLGPHAIRPGARGEFRFVTTMPDMVYQDTTREDYASLRVTPTWFGERFVTGGTNLEIAVHMLPGVEAGEVLYQDRPFTEKIFYQGRTVAYWRIPGARLTGPHMVGVSFPQTGMDRVVRQTKWDLLVMWWEGSPEAQAISGGVLLILFSICFFMLTGGTGWSAFMIILIGVTWWFYVNPVAHLISIPFWPVILGLMFYVARKNKGRQKYLPPIASVEGGGVKRGLTAPEAAVLLELPPGKLITLVIFGLLKKGVLRMTNDKPLTVVVEKDFSGDRPTRLAKASEKGVVLHAYEHAFIEKIAESPFALADLDLSSAIKGLIDHTVERLAGFDVEDTKKYYQFLIKKAWTQAESLGEVEQRTKSVDKNLEWMLMRDDYQEGFGSWERRGYTYYPIWIGGYRRGGLSGSLGGASGSVGRAAGSLGGSGSSFQPSFGDVAGSFAGWTENLAGQAASSIMPGDIGAKSSVLDLSGFDRTTADVFSAVTQGGSGMGGGGGCACAGCACACACAGGGR